MYSFLSGCHTRSLCTVLRASSVICGEWESVAEIMTQPVVTFNDLTGEIHKMKRQIFIFFISPIDADIDKRSIFAASTSSYSPNPLQRGSVRQEALLARLGARERWNRRQMCLKIYKLSFSGNCKKAPIPPPPPPIAKGGEIPDGALRPLDHWRRPGVMRSQ